MTISSTATESQARLADRVLEFLQKYYVASGYVYSGSMPPSSIARPLSVDSAEVETALDELVARGLVQLRDCTAYTFELTAPERVRLIESNDLSIVWEREHPHWFPNKPYGEVESARREAATSSAAFA